jgi:hypothetical protein
MRQDSQNTYIMHAYLYAPCSTLDCSLHFLMLKNNDFLRFQKN